MVSAIISPEKEINRLIIRKLIPGRKPFVLVSSRPGRDSGRAH
ncbi:MAG: hypothetical protein OP8BY_0096 [Candidatus Saccharicenans subterraneus]|uniref:Uncharacterized protein n=1 Tax=Candidatus Saccharicenans subterraneus TaxID=2508984 RepID=A0A3E2BLX3_9BACT|nr:MAG: hypothetical protein OP8BY_0096 [Candidatus Saccharicenans subterraneum]